VRYRRRAQPSVTLSAAAELSKVAASPPADVATAAAAGGCPVHVNGNANGNANASGNASAKTNGAAHAERRMTVVLDRDVCQGHAVCVGECPEVFRLGDDGKVEAILDHPPPELHAKVAAAAQFCPTRAIRLR
jgi:sterol 14-demethylase